MDLAWWSSVSWETIIGDELDTNLDTVTGIASIASLPSDTFYHDRHIPSRCGVLEMMSCHPRSQIFAKNSNKKPSYYGLA